VLILFALNTKFNLRLYLRFFQINSKNYFQRRCNVIRTLIIRACNQAQEYFIFHTYLVTKNNKSDYQSREVKVIYRRNQ
jgi:hypothetical protein